MYGDAEVKGLLHGCRVGRDCPKVSRLLFTDDSIFFFSKANVIEAMVVRNILVDCEKVSGQCVNLRKSYIFFSPCVSNDIRVVISNSFGVTNSMENGSY